LIQDTTRAVHEETVRIVDAQMKDIAVQMQALDEFVTRARSQNGRQHDSQLQTLDGFAANIRGSYRGIHDHLNDLADDANNLRAAIAGQNENVEKSIRHLTAEVRDPLAELQSNIQNAPLIEYTATGDTPQKVQYIYPASLPRTESHEILIAKLRGSSDFSELPIPTNEVSSPRRPNSPAKPVVYNDAHNEVVSLHPTLSEVLVKPTPSSNAGLREVDINVAARQPPPSGCTDASNFRTHTTKDWSTGNKTGDMDDETAPPPPKRQLLSSVVAINVTGDSKLPQKMGRRRVAIAMGQGVVVEGRENRPLMMQSQSGVSHGRRLRSSAQ
jgi:kinesin family protein 11